MSTVDSTRTTDHGYQAHKGGLDNGEAFSSGRASDHGPVRNEFEQSQCWCPAVEAEGFRTAQLSVREPEADEVVTLSGGRLSPVRSIRGVMSRINERVHDGRRRYILRCSQSIIRALTRLCKLYSVIVSTPVSCIGQVVKVQLWDHTCSEIK